MRVLITSGGTKVKIDRVRSITNMSHGTFGSKIANSFVDAGQLVDFLMAKGSKKPARIDESRVAMIVHEYETFDEYDKALFEQLKYEPDIVVLACAASDYGVANYVDGKIRSTEEELVIRLKPLPKLIAKVRDCVPKAVICGFKLLVDSTELQLSRACVDSIIKNRLDLVVGNDWRDIENKNHKLMIYQNMDGVMSFKDYDDKKDNLADIVSKSCIEMYERKNK